MNKPIYKPKGKAREYGEWAVNIYDGCNHGCVYCYAPNVLRKSRTEFEQVKPRPGIVEAIKKQLATDDFAAGGQAIHLCFTCDPYPANIDTTPTREIIKVIKGSGNHVQILTKGGLRAMRDFDLLDENDCFGVTITGDVFQSMEIEPKAGTTRERILILDEAHDKGIKTWVSFEPVYDPSIVYEFIRQASYIDMYKIGKLNYTPSDINWGEFGRECERLCKEYGRNYYIKEDLRKEMTALEAREAQEASFDSYTVDGVKTRIILEQGEE